MLVACIGLGISFALYYITQHHEEKELLRDVALGVGEGTLSAETTFTSLKATLLASVSSVALLRNASAWTRTSSYFLSKNLASGSMTLSWWEALPAKPELGLTQRLQELRDEFGFQSSDTLEPVLFTPSMLNTPLSQYYPDNKTQRQCGPFIRSGSACVLNPNPSSSQCTVDSDCVLILVYPGDAIPLSVSGSAVAAYMRLGIDSSRYNWALNLLPFAYSFSEKQPICTTPANVRLNADRAWGVYLYMPVFNVEDLYSEAATPSFYGYAASAVHSQVFASPLQGLLSLNNLWWALWDLESNTVLAASHDFDTAQPSIEAARQAAQRQSLLATDSITESFTAFGRTWVFEAAATEEARSDLATDTPIYVLTTGLMVTVFLTVLLVVYLKHRQTRSHSKLLQEQTKLDAEQRVHDAVLGYVHHELRGPLHIVGACMSEALLLLKRMAKEASTGPDVLDITNVARGPPTIAESKSRDSDESLGSREQDLPGLIKRAQEYLTNGTDASNALSRQLQDLMDLQQLQRGQFECRMAGVDMVLLLRQLVDSLKGSARVPVTLDVAKLQESLRLMGIGTTTAAEETFIETDGLRVRQILYTGLMNAINHTEDGHVECIAWLGSEGDNAASAMVTITPDDSKTCESTTALRHLPRKSSLGRKPSNPSSAFTRECWLFISVVDTGSRKSTRFDEFTPFAAFDTEKKQLAQLSSDGVGMPLSHLIAAAMGGSVTVTQLDSGCEYRVRLPVKVQVYTKDLGTAPSEMTELTDIVYREGWDRASERPVPSDASRKFSAALLRIPPAQELERFAPHHVLVVDDVSLNVRLAANMLKRKGHTSECISSGDFLQAISTKLQERRQLVAPSAFDALRDAPPFTVLFLDIRLGTANGVHILQKLRREWKSSPPAVRPPVVIAMTASTTSEDVGVYKKAGFDGILAKPFSVDKIQAVLDCINLGLGDDGHMPWVQILG